MDINSVVREFQRLSAIFGVPSLECVRASRSILGALHNYFFKLSLFEKVTWLLDIPSDDRFSWSLLRENTAGFYPSLSRMFS